MIFHRNGVHSRTNYAGNNNNNNDNSNNNKNQNRIKEPRKGEVEVCATLQEQD